METALAEHDPLNPFAVVSDTTFRFALLCTALLSATLFLHGLLFTSLFFKSVLAPSVRCTLDVAPRLRNAAQAFGASTGEASSAGEAVEREYRSAVAADAACVVGAERKQLSWKIGGLLLLAGTSVALFRGTPWWIRRRRRLIALTDAQAPDLPATIVRLSRQARLPRVPLVLWSPLGTSVNALAFGSRSHPVVALSGGTVKAFKADPSAFEAVVLHELAHLRNGDVSQTYFGIALTISWLLIAVVPYVVYLGSKIHLGALGFSGEMILRAVAILLCVFGLLRGFLRARELHADARAMSWGASNATLQRLLAADPPGQSGGGALRAIFATHPSNAERRATMDAPERLLRMGVWEAAGTGLAASLAIRSLYTLLRGFSRAFGVTNAITILAAVLSAALICGVVGTGLWRMALLQAWRRITFSDGPFKLSLALALGAVAGQLIAYDALSRMASDRSTLSTLGLGTMIAALLCAAVYGVSAWIATCGMSWSHARSGTALRAAYLATIATAASAIGLALHSILNAYELAESAETSVAFVLVTLISEPATRFWWLLLPLTAAMCMLPAWGSRSDSSALVLDDIATGTRRGWLHAIAIAGIATAIYATVLSMLRISVGASVSIKEISDAMLVALGQAELSKAAIVVALAGMVASMNAGTERGLHGLRAALLTAGAAAVTLAALYALDDCFSFLNVADQTLECGSIRSAIAMLPLASEHSIGFGLLLALPAIGAGAAIAAAGGATGRVAAVCGVIVAGMLLVHDAVSVYSVGRPPLPQDELTVLAVVMCLAQLAAALRMVAGKGQRGVVRCTAAALGVGLVATLAHACIAFPVGNSGDGSGASAAFSIQMVNNMVPGLGTSLAVGLPLAMIGTIVSGALAGLISAFAYALRWIRHIQLSPRNS